VSSLSNFFVLTLVESKSPIVDKPAASLPVAQGKYMWCLSSDLAISEISRASLIAVMHSIAYVLTLGADPGFRFSRIIYGNAGLRK
jgi:hypothetical protein